MLEWIRLMRMTEGAEGQRSAAICVLQWTINQVDSSNGGRLKLQKD
jgi:hypothetical protein